MEYNKEKKEIILKRELNNLDRFVLNFVRILEKYIDYVIFSGYISILLGRTRATEDVDILVKEIPEDKFEKLWRKALKLLEGKCPDKHEDEAEKYAWCELLGEE